jgi:hypothetical protein
MRLQIYEIKARRVKVKEVLEQWPRNTLRKSEPGLWSDLRKIVLGRLDGSSLPMNLEHSRDSAGLRVLGDLNLVLPSLHEKWNLPEDVRRTLDSDPRSASWQEMDVLTEIEEFLQAKIAAAQSEIDRMEIRSSELDENLSQLNTELQLASIEFEKSRIALSNSDVKGN